MSSNCKLFPVDPTITCRPIISSFLVTDDVVKVEIWDIVDKGKTKKRDGLKMDTEDIVCAYYSVSS